VELLTYAQTALTAAQAALPAVGRYLLAGGPELALVCHQVAVYPGPVQVQRLGQDCAFVTNPQVVVAYSKDCYPMVKTDPAVQLPPPAEVTTWTEAYMADVAALYDGLLDAVMSGDFGGTCTGVRLEAANYSGPRGGVCSVRIPLTILPAA
jgi:hypothetical protein